MTGWFTALVLARALDVTSTCVVLSQGGREANPIMPTSCQGHVLTGTAVTVGQILATRWLAVRHPRFARWSLGLSASVHGAAFTFNLTQMR